MITQITKGQKGITEYLTTGETYYSEYKRDEKDRRVPIMGDLDSIKMSEESQLDKSNKKYNYYHCSLSFTRDEWERLEAEGKIEDLLKEYIRLQFPNHEIDEMIYYAEAHLPILQSEPYQTRNDKSKNASKLNEKYEGKMIGRIPHIHLIISMENMKYSRQITSGGIIYSKNKSQIAASAIKFKKLVDEILCDKFDLSYVDQENLDERYKKFKLSLEEKEKEYEKFAVAARKVVKGKLRPSVVTHENEKEPIITIPNSKDINFKEINISIEELKEDKSSIVSNELLKANEEKIKNTQKDIAKVLRETDVNIFLPTLISRYKIPKGAFRAGENNRVNFDFKNKDGSITTRNLTIIDYCTKQLNMRFSDAVDELTLILNDQKSIQTVIPQSDKIKISVSNDFKILPDSTNKKPKYQALNGWKTIEIEPSNLESTLKSYSAISMAVFERGERSNENIIGVNPLLIYDVDNSDNKKPQFTISDAVNTLSSKGIQGYIYPSASHLLDKKTQKFRLLIPTLNAFDYLKHKTTGYKIYMDNTTKFLGLKDKVDEVYKTPSQLYYTPKKDTELIIVPGQVLDNGKIIKQSEQDIELVQEKEIIKQKGFEGILKEYRHAKAIILQHEPKDNEKYLTRVSLQGLYDNVPIYDLMSYFDSSTRLIKEGENTILHNKQGRHLYFKQENTAYLFKKNKHYTPYIYLVDRFNEAKQAIDERIY
ncbi:aminotransferase [Campylobacter sp. CCUG 57310]|uniref:aminotransferase n=1 Tax=Campylobacter sp. CCUG 57310 TaxID=2517362 RepID=UPI001567AA9E|nr:aminotransferase [Campylobacter sp. CCUG 57310]QKF93124.1 aminotransferase [Campylobacter sp. CCUG 57310]